jgi:hypothetical protein
MKNHSGPLTGSGVLDLNKKTSGWVYDPFDSCYEKVSGDEWPTPQLVNGQYQMIIPAGFSRKIRVAKKRS